MRPPDLSRVLVLLISSLCLLTHVSSWSLNKILMTGPKANHLVDNFTRNNNLWTKYQVHTMFMKSMDRGSMRAAKECRHQFKWDRWNCPIVDMNRQIHNIRANRETSFVHAIYSASIMHDLTSQCNLGGNPVCACDDSRNGVKGGYNWSWGGCSDNIKFGDSVSKHFLMSMQKAKDSYAATVTQNSGAGRMSVRKTTHLICKCHGVSGSCSVRTCWRQLGNFRSVGNYLKRRYKKAVHANFFDGKLRQGNDVNGVKLNMISNKQLVFLEKSPNYCKANDSLSLNGTLGRQCSRNKVGVKQSAAERKSCRTLCKACGLLVKHEVVTIRTTCNCRFHWCCHVACFDCEQKQDVYSCSK
ncbi:protein Wnt-8b-like [Mizuhopecten yessoensis]|uniref:Protein Wnt n=1 Tax=Mizuhopecten yessoensis TaxID=6573 RepID=A0A210PFG6_MIZYE|nr:protein Wnt-8b-like [Mizuhopecten yessoensis]OWF35229.1 Protein Wnt-8 [Mizuhopecten yessoensis]